MKLASIAASTLRALTSAASFLQSVIPYSDIPNGASAHVDWGQAANGEVIESNTHSAIPWRPEAADQRYFTPSIANRFLDAEASSLPNNVGNMTQSELEAEETRLKCALAFADKYAYEAQKLRDEGCVYPSLPSLLDYTIDRATKSTMTYPTTDDGTFTLTHNNGQSYRVVPTVTIKRANPDYKKDKTVNIAEGFSYHSILPVEESKLESEISRLTQALTRHGSQANGTSPDHQAAMSEAFSKDGWDGAFRLCSEVIRKEVADRLRGCEGWTLTESHVFGESTKDTMRGNTNATTATVPTARGTEADTSGVSTV